MSTHCKSIYDKYIERYNSLLSRHIHRNYRVNVSDIQHASQIVLEVDKFMKTLEQEVRRPKIKKQDTELENNNLADDEPLEVDCDTDRNTKTLEGKKYKATVEKVGEWHKNVLKAVLEREVVYRYEDQWLIGLSCIQKQIDLYDEYLKKH